MLLFVVSVWFVLRRTCELWTFRDSHIVFVLFCVCCLFVLCFVFGLFFVVCVVVLFLFFGFTFCVMVCFCHVPAPRLVRLGDHNRTVVHPLRILYYIYCNPLYYSILHYTILSYTILFYTILHTVHKLSISYGFAFGPL